MAIDETKLKKNGICIYVWSAIDIDNYKILAIRVSRTSSMDAHTLKMVLKVCVKKPLILVDKDHDIHGFG